MRILPLFLFPFAVTLVVSAQDPVKVDPAHYRVLFENTHTRVLEYRDKPGDKAPMHSHPAYMTYVTGTGRFKDILPSGETSIDEIVGSKFDCRPPTTHAGQNVGNTATQELLVEFKDATNPCSGQQTEARGSNAQESAQAEKEILTLQDALIAAYIHRDTATLDRILADEYTFINDDAGGVVNKKQILDSFKAGGDREITSYTRQDDHVRLYGDVAFLTYRYHSTETYKGRENGGDFRVTRIFVKRDGQWQMVGGQETRVSTSQPTFASAPSSARDRLVGTWRLVSAEDVHPDGSAQPFPEYGPRPVGYLMYDSTGHMCVTLANPSPPHWADPAKPTDAERVLTHKAMEAYCGTYEVREKEGQVIHRPELAEWPHYIGSDQVRNFRFEGDRLILSLEETIPNGGWRRSRITWERVADPVASAAPAKTATLNGKPAPSEALAYASVEDIAAALRDIGNSNGDKAVVRLAPYTVLAEHRAMTKNLAVTASIHKNEAELYYVIDGSATLVTGRTPDQPSGGVTQRIRKGDMLIIPENTPHWFSAVDEPLSYVSMHMPRPHSSSPE
jgi:beta-alanine degradation protein BauB